MCVGETSLSHLEFLERLSATMGRVGARHLSISKDPQDPSKILLEGLCKWVDGCGKDGSG